MNVCIDCTNPITRSASGRCKSCAAKARHRHPVMYAEFCAAAKRGADTRMAKVGERERLQQSMLSVRHQPVGEAELRRRAAIKHTMIGWCPEHLRDYAMKLKRQGYKLAERKVMIAGEVRREQAEAGSAERRRIAALSPHERQLERIRAGARVVERVPMPRRGAEHVVGGSSLADCG